MSDVNIVWITIKKFFIRRNITDSTEEIDITLDYGDVLLKNNTVTRQQYNLLQKIAKEIMEEHALKS